MWTPTKRANLSGIAPKLLRSPLIDQLPSPHSTSRPLAKNAVRDGLCIDSTDLLLEKGQERGDQGNCLR